MADTPNMNLTLPIVGSTLGPEYAELNNEAFEEIDSHDHTSGKGVAVPTVGLNINANLPFNGFAATEVNALSLQDVSGTPADLSVYSDNGNLYYRNAAGNAVLVTDGDSIAGTVGSIAGLGDGGSSATFSDLSESFSWFYNGAKLAAFNMGDIRLYPFDGTTEYTNFITLKSPLTLSSDYSLTLATALPASTQLVQVSAAGLLTYSNTIANSLTLGDPLFLAGGSAAIPTYTFTADTDTGFYLDGSGAIGASTAGVKRLSISSAAVEFEVPIYVDGGSDGSPTLTFASDTDTGIFNAGADIIGFTTAGNQRATLSSTAFASSVAITAPSIDLASGGAFKVKIVSWTAPSMTAGAQYTTSVAHGLSYSSIRGVLAFVGNTTPGQFYGVGSDPSFAGNQYELRSSWGATTIDIAGRNGTSVTLNQGYAIVFYV